MGLNNSKSQKRDVLSLNQGESKLNETEKEEKRITDRQSNEPTDGPIQTSGLQKEAAAAVQELNEHSTSRFFQPQTKTISHLRTQQPSEGEEEGKK